MIVITAATGKLGHHVVDALLAKVPASQITVAVRNPDKAKDFAEKGITVRLGDYSKPDTLRAAFRGADKLLLISSSEVGQRERQPKAAIAAAVAEKVPFLAYTSILHADTSRMALALEHLATERAIQASGISYAFLRNGWYLENYSENLGAALAHGVLLGSAQSGKIAAATRKDFAEAAATVLTSEGHANKIYELAGDVPFTMSELAKVVADAAGNPVAYQDLSVSDYTKALVGFGVPPAFAEVLADSDAGIARGELDDRSGDLKKLIGHATTPLRGVIETAVRAAKG
ncbi:MAG: SDR family oxidoreductase [Polyangiaceae bacterium]